MVPASPDPILPIAELEREQRNVLEVLVRRVEADPLPADHTSSHWRLYGERTAVRIRDGALELSAEGFLTLYRSGWLGRIAEALEYASYRHVTRRMRSFAPIWRRARSLAARLGGTPSFHVLKTACALATLADHFDEHGLDPRTFLLIGDGDGFFGALLRASRPRTRVYSIDLPKQLVFQFRTHVLADRSTRFCLADDAGAWDVTLLGPDDGDAVSGTVDCAVNIASMQEMTPDAIDGYFRLLRRTTSATSRFYCVNRERKVLPGGEVSEFRSYPWVAQDRIFLDGPCPYFTHYVSPSTGPLGPRVLGVRVPFVNHFDGRVLHRLARLARPDG